MDEACVSGVFVPDTPRKPQDFAGLRAELDDLANEFTPVIGKLWPRLEDHK